VAATVGGSNFFNHTISASKEIWTQQEKQSMFVLSRLILLADSLPSVAMVAD
jgi:hypothetical protein